MVVRLRFRRPLRVAVPLVIAAATGAAVTLGTWIWAYLRPVVDEEEVAEARVFAERSLRDAAQQHCPRPVLRGQPTGGDATAAYAALLDPRGPFAACWAFLEEADDRVRALVSYTDDVSDETRNAELPPWSSTDEREEAPPLADGWDSFVTGRPFPRVPTALEANVLTHCGAASRALSRIVEHESVCSPYPLAIPSDGVMIVPLRLARVIAVAARDHLRRGELQAGFALLFDGIRGAADLMRGRATLLTTMIAVAMVGILVGQLEMLFALDLAWDEATIRTLQDEIEILAATTPTPDGFQRNEPVAMLGEYLRQLGWTPPHPLPPLDASSARADAGTARAQAVALHRSALRFAALRCDARWSRKECHGQLSPRASDVDRLDATFEITALLLGPRAIRGAVFEHVHAELAEVHVRYAHRLAVADAAIRAQWIILEHRRLHVDGRACMTAAELDAALGDIPTEAGLGGAFSILESGLPYRPIEVSGPPWLRPAEEVRPDVRLPLARAYCPVFPVPGGPEE